MFWIFNLMILFSQNAFARSLKATADKLGQEAIDIGYTIGVFGLAVAIITLILGKQDAAQKITGCLFGVLLLASVKSLITTIKGMA
jgi:hypothetical protein